MCLYMLDIRDGRCGIIIYYQQFIRLYLTGKWIKDKFPDIALFCIWYIEGIGYTPDEIQLLFGHHLVFIDKFDKAQENNKFFPL